MWRREPWCCGERPGVEETALVLSRAPWCAGERHGMEEGVLVWRRAPWCGGGRPGVEKGALVWMRMPGCHWKGEGGAPGSEESASKEREQCEHL